MTMLRIRTASLLILLAPGGLLASDAELPAGLRACAAQTDPVKRLACYDAEMSRHAPSGAAATAKPQTPEERFGYRGAVAREEIEREKALSPSVQELRSKVKALTRGGRGELVIALDNGQVWVQRAPDTRFDLDVGDAVVVKSAALGSFLLVSPGGGSTRVTRAK